MPHFACQTKPVAPKEFQADLTAAAIIAVIKTFSLFVDSESPRLIFISSPVELEIEMVAFVVYISVPRTVAAIIDTNFLVTSVENRWLLELGIHNKLVCQLRMRKLALVLLDVALGSECNHRPFCTCHIELRNGHCNETNAKGDNEPNGLSMCGGT